MSIDPAAELVLIRVVGDEDETEEMVVLLRRELLELDLAQADRVRSGESTASAKGLGALTGWLAVRLGTVPLRTMIESVVSWAGRSNRTVELRIGDSEIKVGNATRDQQNRLIDAWLARHGAGS